jgi:hypothetical protein
MADIESEIIVHRRVEMVAFGKKVRKYFLDDGPFDAGPRSRLAEAGRHTLSRERRCVVKAAV